MRLLLTGVIAGLVVTLVADLATTVSLHRTTGA
jgi:hypothetical protein